MYREMIKPYHSRMYQYVRNRYPNIKVFLHSCGAIIDLIPDLIDAGVEVLNPVQIGTFRGGRKNKQEYSHKTLFVGWSAGCPNERKKP